MNEQHIEDSYPISPLQQGMLFHSLYAPQSGIYVPQMIWTLHEDLNVSAFKQAWEQVVKRHPILRTSFHWEGLEEPLQKVHQQVNLPLIQEDWRGLSAQEQESRLETYLQNDLRHDFKFTKSPLMRLALFQISETDYQFIWTYHHALLDGLSRLLIVKEIFAYYEALCQGVDLQLKQPRPYRAHIEWLQQQNLSKAKAFWQQTLRGFSAPTSLIQDQKTDSMLAREKFDIPEQEITLSKAETSALKSLAQQHGLTLNTVLQGAWVLLLSRYSGSEDVVFGATRACRHSTVKETKDMVGLFINMLPIRVQVSPEMLLIPWLKKLRAQWITMREYEHTPLLKIQEWSDLPLGTPLFESIHDFRYSSVESALCEQGGNWKRREFRILHQSNVPLVFQGFGETELLLKIQYNRSRFDFITIERMFRHYKTLLEGMVANPKRRLLDLPLLTETERYQLLMEWNDTQATYPQDECIHQLFETQADRTPDAIAVVFEDKQTTYRELNSQSNQLAHYLTKHNVGPETLVGICMERSVEMVIGLLGILKAGGAYVPLDPMYPKERLAFILQDTAVPVLLTQQRLLEALPECGAKVICLDANWEIIAKEKTDNLVSEATAENLAYVIYTSGSTGKPKGVLVTHGNVTRLMKATESWYNFDQEDVWTLFHSYAFDFSVWEIWGALSYGGRLVIVPYDVSRSPKDCYNLMMNERVTVLNQTPSAFYQLIQAEETLLTKNDLALRLIIFGGEALEFQNLKPWFKRHGDKNPQLVNMYGITETTVHVTYRPISNEDVQSGQGSVIGERIPDLQLYVLDGNLQPVPIGVTGELFVGGAGLARGYLNRPELTVERFIPNPYSNNPGARLYKTGDVARYLPNRDLEYLGRADQQVQIRGFRVELGEIEVVLAGYPGVNMTVVIAREDVPGDTRLVAYVVASHELTPTISELRSFLKEKLPDYMIPSAFVFLDSLPLTPNGKVDRRALPKPDGSLTGPIENFVPPRNPVEATLAQIWANLLRVEQVGVHDNFFELGGHSLLATRVISHVRDTFQVELPVHCFFDAPTVAGLTEVLKNYETVPGRVLAIAQILEKIDAMDAEEIREMLHDKRKNRGL